MIRKDGLDDLFAGSLTQNFSWVKPMEILAGTWF